jgi:hypothetical protein
LVDPVIRKRNIILRGVSAEIIRGAYIVTLLLYRANPVKVRIKRPETRVNRSRSVSALVIKDAVILMHS